MALPFKERSPKKREIEFDMFARDLPPEENDDVRGGSGTPPPSDHRTTKPLPD